MISSAASRAGPCYFGPRRELFGFFHPAERERTASCAVVLCQPLGQEAIRAHRALRQLAVRLAGAGFPTLRFDFYGCGDSAGSVGDWTVERWVEDVASARLELAARSGLDRVCLIGIRLGATLSLQGAGKLGDVDGLVLWEPVIDGSVYVRGLWASHRSYARRFPGRKRAIRSSEGEREALGFALPERLVVDISELDVLGFQVRPARSALVIDRQGEHGRSTELVRLLTSLGARVEYEQITDQRLWVDDIDRVVVPHLTLTHIAGWLERTYA